MTEDFNYWPAADNHLTVVALDVVVIFLVAINIFINHWLISRGSESWIICRELWRLKAVWSPCCRKRQKSENFSFCVVQQDNTVTCASWRSECEVCVFDGMWLVSALPAAAALETLAFCWRVSKWLRVKVLEPVDQTKWNEGRRRPTRMCLHYSRILNIFLSNERIPSQFGWDEAEGRPLCFLHP